MRELFVVPALRLLFGVGCSCARPGYSNTRVYLPCTALRHIAFWELNVPVQVCFLEFGWAEFNGTAGNGGETEGGLLLETTTLQHA
jgi:hypothetical protein